MTPTWLRLYVRATPRSGTCLRYTLHQAVADLWDGHRPVWRLVRWHGGIAEIVVLADRMTVGRPSGPWGCVDDVRVGPVRVPAHGETVWFAGSIVATAKPGDGPRRELSSYYRDEDVGELYAAYVQRRLSEAATVRWAEVHRVEGIAVRRRGRAPMVFAPADVSGVLTVRDSVALLSALCEGVGRGKAWGFGLLTLSGEDWTWWQ